MKYKAVLFDFDGTLADTMANHYRCWKQVFKEHDIEVKETDYYPMEGASLHKIAVHFSGLDEENFINSLVKKKKQLYVEMHKQSAVSFYPEVEAVVEILSKKFSLAIVTAGHEDQLRATVPEIFLNRFSAIVCGDKVKKNKPYPDPYITACRELDASPKDCIVVENAPLGVESAVSAGCYCVGVTSTCEPSILSKAHELIPKISDIYTTKVLKSSFSC